MAEPITSSIQPETSTQEIARQVQSYVEQQARQDKFSGAVVVAKNGKLLLEIATGFANKDKQVQNQVDTKFNLGSSTKMFTGVAICQLVEKGLLTFDTLVGKVLPHYPSETLKSDATIHNLLTHTAGLGSFIDLQHREELLARRQELTNISAVVDLFKEKPLPFPIGEFHYSSNGYELLGSIIETISSQRYYDYVREHIFDVVGMSNTDSYEIDPGNTRADIAIGYTHRNPITDEMVEGERFDNSGLNLLKGTAGGSGYSTCRDMLSFTEALQHNELLSPSMTIEALKPRVKEGSRDGQTKYSGYGFQVFEMDGFQRIGHPGRFAGVNTRIDMYPESRYTVIALANYDPPSALNVGVMAEKLITPKLE